MDALAAMVRAGGYDIGIAFDGDADRCLAVDERGELIDGDQIMAACGLDMKRKGKLPGNAVVATVMSNLGLHLFAKEHGWTWSAPPWATATCWSVCWRRAMPLEESSRDT